MDPAVTRALTKISPDSSSPTKSPPTIGDPRMLVDSSPYADRDGSDSESETQSQPELLPSSEELPLQFYLSEERVREAVRRVRRLKHAGMPCFWTASVPCKPNDVVQAFMFGFVVAEYTGVVTRYLDITAPMHVEETRASKYMDQVYKIQTRRLKKVLKGVFEQGLNWGGSTSTGEFRGETVRVGAQRVHHPFSESLVGRTVLIHLEICPISETENRSQVISVVDLC
ncbi:hypothetical protein B0H16DRAFT_1475014 [Mycena metata]|uniref:Uncharacterized protein n=1 Tax=Mycena metata TaxID=1033252 RepID=A0AAD7HGH1_9AGAR|nr:hypothetical protein B0H16DRAFT_1475014 [Mycena metata]